MLKKFCAILAATFSLSTMQAFAEDDIEEAEQEPIQLEQNAESVQFEREVKTVSDTDVISLKVPKTKEQMPEYLVGGAIKDVTQKILPLSAEVRYFAPHLDMKVKSDSIQYNNGSVGLKDDLGFGNDKAPELILRYKRMSLDYIHVHGTGDTNLTLFDTLRFSGKSFSGDIHSQSDFHYIKLNVTNPIINVLGTGIDWSYGLTGMYWKGSVRGSERYTGRSIKESKEYGVPVPTLGIGAHAAITPNINAFAHISGLPLGGYGHFYDFEAGVRYNPLELLGISVGFRRIDVNVSHDDDSGKIKLNGPYAGLRFDF